LSIKVRTSLSGHNKSSREVIAQLNLIFKNFPFSYFHLMM
jgi:hypothetical protein